MLCTLIALAGGYVPTSAITAQIAALNNQYYSSGFQFKLTAIDRTINVNWFNGVGPAK